jgi:hypothetical protein
MNRSVGDISATAVGFRGRLFRTINRDIQIIKIDPISEEPFRGKDGFCVKVCDLYKKNNGIVFKTIITTVRV